MHINNIMNIVYNYLIMGLAQDLAFDFCMHRKWGCGVIDDWHCVKKHAGKIGPYA